MVGFLTSLSPTLLMPHNFFRKKDKFIEVVDIILLNKLLDNGISIDTPYLFFGRNNRGVSPDTVYRNAV